MKQFVIFLFTGILSMSGKEVFAQGVFYTVETQTGQPYNSLPASALGFTAWSAFSVFNIPLPFTARINGKTTTTLYFFGPTNLCNAPNQGVQHTVFGWMDSELTDEGGGRSPIRYQTTGSSPNRIFKYEIRNAKLRKYQASHTTFLTSDSLSFQYWLYEGTNDLELRVGPHHVSPDSSYFGIGEQLPYIGLYADSANGLLPLYSLA